MSEVKVFDIPHELLIQAPEGVLARMSTQLDRWFGIKATALDLLHIDVRVRTNEATPPEWMLLFEALQVAHWDTVQTALTVLEKVRKDSIKHRPKVNATVIDAAV